MSTAATDATVAILFPLEQRISWEDTFGAPRSGGRTHAGNDLMVPKMTPVLAVVDGTVDWLNLTGKLSSYNDLPYYNILLRGDDGNDYFYVHLNNDTPGTDDGKGGVRYAYAPGLTNGTHVKCGDVIGYVGDSGNAEDTGSHLHFEIHLGGYVSASGTQTRSPSAIGPYASLKAARTLAEWIAAGRPPLTTNNTEPASTTTTTVPTGNATTSTTVPQTTTTTSVSDGNLPRFSDVRATDWFYPDLAQAWTDGVVSQEADNRFRPYSLASRALFTAYLARTMAPDELASIGDVGSEDIVFETTFHDVPASYWAHDEIEVAARLGLVRGTGDGSSFSPDALITRAQMATMLCRALGLEISAAQSDAADAHLLYNDVPQGYWAQGPIVLMRTYGLMCGDANKCFRPEENTNRAQAITVMARLMRILQGEAGR